MPTSIVVTAYFFLLLSGAFASLAAQPRAQCAIRQEASHSLQTPSARPVWLFATAAVRLADGIAILGTQAHIWETAVDGDSRSQSGPVRLWQSDSVLGVLLRQQDATVIDIITNPLVGRKLQNVSAATTDDGDLHVVVAAASAAPPMSRIGPLATDFWHGTWTRNGWRAALRRFGAIGDAPISMGNAMPLTSNGSEIALAHAVGEWPRSLLLWTRNNSGWQSDTLVHSRMITSELSLSANASRGWDVHFRAIHVYRASFTAKWNQPQMLIRSSATPGIRAIGTVGDRNRHLWWTEPSDGSDGALLLAAPIHGNGLVGRLDTIANGLDLMSTRLAATMNDDVLVWLTASPGRGLARLAIKHVASGALSFHDLTISAGPKTLLVPVAPDRLWVVADAPRSWTTGPPFLVVNVISLSCH
jgi:hypothetical protein